MTRSGTEMFLQSLLMQAAPPGGGLGSTALMVGLMFLVFWLLVWRPQRKEKDRLEALLDQLKAGDEVVTTSGLLGKVVRLDDRIVTLEVSKGTKIKMLRSQIQGLQSALLAEESKTAIKPDA